jgi:hypothetical protein
LSNFIPSAQPNELSELEEFFVCHGTNSLSYLPERGVEDQLQRLKIQTDGCFNCNRAG